MYVLGTGKSNPFDGLKNLDMKWDQLARCGRRPPCPERFCGMDNVSTKLLYDLLSNMWGADPQARPTADFVKSKLLSIATTLDSKFSEPVAPQQPIDFQPLLLFTLSIDKYQWNEARVGISLIEALHPYQRAVVAVLITLAMSPSVVEVRTTRIKHIIAVILLARAQQVLSPALFYFGLKDSLSGAVPLDDHERFRDVADILLAAEVSRVRVVETLCRQKGVQERALIEYWDSIRRESKNPPPVASRVSFFNCACPNNISGF